VKTVGRPLLSSPSIPRFSKLIRTRARTSPASIIPALRLPERERVPRVTPPPTRNRTPRWQGGRVPASPRLEVACYIPASATTSVSTRWCLIAARSRQGFGPGVRYHMPSVVTSDTFRCPGPAQSRSQVGTQGTQRLISEPARFLFPLPRFPSFRFMSRRKCC